VVFFFFIVGRGDILLSFFCLRESNPREGKDGACPFQGERNGLRLSLRKRGSIVWANNILGGGGRVAISIAAIIGEKINKIYKQQIVGKKGGERCLFCLFCQR